MTRDIETRCARKLANEKSPSGTHVPLQAFFYDRTLKTAARRRIDGRVIAV